MLNRRTLLQTVGSSALLAPWPSWGALNLDDRADRLTALAKMRGSTDDRLSIGWIIGSRYAIVDSRPVPMHGILAGTFSRYRRVDADRFEARALEIAFFTDNQTGKLLETWRNPVTDQVIDVPQVRMGPSTIIMTVDGLTVPNPSGDAAGLDLQHFFREPVRLDDNVWMTEEIRIFGAPRRPGGRPFSYNETTTYQARQTDLDDPGLTSVPVQVQFSSVVSMRRWMGFGDTPGYTAARGFGGRVRDPESLPSQYLDLVRAHHGDVLADPLGVLAADKAVGESS